MRIAIFSDVHANLVALEAALADIRRQSVDQMVCLGDVAASGPQPHQVIQRLSELKIPCVMGNADQWLLEPEPYRGENEIYRKVSEIDSWCAHQLTAVDFNFLRSFQETIELPFSDEVGLLCYHGSPRSNTDIITASSPEADLASLLFGSRATVLAGGHTHVQMLRHYRVWTLINPGSVGLGYELGISGEKTHNIARAEYAILDWDAGDLGITFRRVPFDLIQVRQAAWQSDMPYADWWAGEWLA
jgi:putative phosphoesterase